RGFSELEPRARFSSFLSACDAASFEESDDVFFPSVLNICGSARVGLFSCALKGGCAWNTWLASSVIANQVHFLTMGTPCDPKFTSAPPLTIWRVDSTLPLA